MTELPKVSIITPSYNQGKFIEETILSVLNQDYANIGYIIIDGGSTDNTIDIIKKYQHRLAYWISEPDNGQSNVINKGFQRANGQIFNWLNSDDILVPLSVKIAVDYLVKNADVGMIYGDRIIIDHKGNFLSHIRFSSFRKFEMIYNQQIPEETAFFRRYVWSKVGGLDETLHYCMDYDLWCKFN